MSLPVLAKFSAFLQIRPIEAKPVAFVAALFALIQAGQGIGSNAADGLFFIRYGVEFLPYMFVALGAASFFMVLFYNAGHVRIPRRIYITALLVSFATILILERVAISSDLTVLYPLLWLTVNIVNVMLGFVVWFMAGEVCDTRQAKRLFPLFASAGILGGILGNLITGALANSFGIENLLLIFAGLLLGAVILCWQILARFFRPPARRDVRVSLFGELRGSYEYLRSSNLLKLTAFASILFSVLYFSIFFPFSRVASSSFPKEADLAGFLGLFSGAASSITFLVSLVFANRIYARVGIVNAVLILPLVYLGGFGLWLIQFGLGAAVIARLAQMVTMDGVATTAWIALFNVAPAERKGQLLGFDAGVISHIGIAISGLLLILGGQLLNNREFLVIGMVFAVACAYLMWRMRGAYGEALLEALRSGRFEVFSASPRAFAGFHGNAQAREVALKSLLDERPSTRRLAAQILGKMGDREAVPGLVDVLRDPDAQVRWAALHALGELDASGSINELVPLLNDTEDEVRAETLNVLGQLGGGPRRSLISKVQALLHDPNQKVAAKAAIAVAHWGQVDAALARLNELLSDEDSETRVQALIAWHRIVLVEAPIDLKPVIAATRDPSVAVRQTACEVLAFQDKAAIEALIICLNDPDAAVRATAAKSLRSLGQGAVAQVLEVLGKGDDRSEEAALDALVPDDPRLYEPLHTYAVNEIAQARSLNELSRSIPPVGRATRLARELLKSRAAQSEVKLVKAVGLLGHGEAIALVAKSLRTHGGHHRAEAVEALDALGDKRLAREIIPLLDEAPTENNGHREITPSDAIGRMMVLQDDWARALAARSASELRLHDVAPKLREVAERDPDPLPREAARAALVELGEALPMETLQTVSLLERMLLLRDVPLFADLPPDDLKQIAELTREQLYSDGAIICREGEEGDEMYVIASGQARVSRHSGGQEIVLATRGIGEFLGEMAIIESSQRSATLTAEGETRLLVIDGKSFKSILRDRPEVSLAVLRGMSRRLREKF